MLFHSWPFLALLAATFALYYAPGLRKAQLAVLLAASMVFYAWHLPWLLALLAASVVLNAAVSFRVHHGPDAGRTAWAIGGVAANLGLLAAFKYGGLLAGTLAGLAGASPGAWLVALPLPIGISFYTFEGISLVVDAWRARTRPEAPGGYAPDPDFWVHLRRTQLFVSFFPHLVAGPILKAHDFLTQVGPKRLRDVPWDAAFRALTAGYFLKIVVADHLAAHTAWLAAPHFLHRASIDLAALVLGFSVQIFADFAGYSLIAIGLGALFGYRLPENFHFPYVATSFRDFWSRWHVSLSRWLRAYLYVPLGGNRRGPGRTYLNLMVVMVLGGLWHGAAWSFAAWGAWHGLALARARRLAPRRAPPPPGAGRARGGGARGCGWVSVGWLLFKLTDVRDVLAFGRAFLANGALAPDAQLVASIALLALPVALYHAGHVWAAHGGGAWVRRAEPLAYGACLALLLLDPGYSHDFIYFQF